MAWGNLLNLSASQFPHLSNRDNSNDTYFKQLLSEERVNIYKVLWTEPGVYSKFCISVWYCGHINTVTVVNENRIILLGSSLTLRAPFPQRGFSGPSVPVPTGSPSLGPHPPPPEFPPCTPSSGRWLSRGRLRVTAVQATEPPPTFLPWFLCSVGLKAEIKAAAALP